MLPIVVPEKVHTAGVRCDRQLAHLTNISHVLDPDGSMKTQRHRPDLKTSRFPQHLNLRMLSAAASLSQERIIFPPKAECGECVVCVCLCTEAQQENWWNYQSGQCRLSHSSANGFLSGKGPIDCIPPLWRKHLCLQLNIHFNISYQFFTFEQLEPSLINE